MSRDGKIAGGLVAAIVVTVAATVAILAARPERPKLTSVGNGSGSEVAVAPVADGHQAPDPSGLRIPAIEVEASTIPLGLRADGSIEVPQDYDETGWWRDGPEPGEIGPAVILGHVDSQTGPAVFHRLDSLSVGDPIHIDRIDGSTVTYLVERVEQHAKSAFPTDAVYGSTDEPVLRLVTCGGEFDRSARSYRDNIVVFARAA